jgi:hypothetical protein
LILLAQAGTAEQKVHLGPFDVHYMVAPSTFFNEQIAERYQIKRGRDRALLNLSILNDSQTPVAAAVEGDVTNLLGQITTLEFREVSEGGAIYYLAALKFADRETLRFRISMTMADGVSRELKFQQQMFWDGP